MITQLNFEPDRLGNYMEFVPYITTMTGLYTADLLYDGFNTYDPSSLYTCYDRQVYEHFIETGKRTDNPLELLSRTIHDHCIVHHLNEFLMRYDKKKVVGVMGGNAMKRTDEAYRKIVLFSKTLTEHGSLMVSGGGSGAMEATALGGMMAGRSEEEVDDALRMLAAAPCIKDEGYLKTSFEVRDKYPQLEGYEVLTIPTWLYGHEPTTPFASHIAKLFENSIREDTLLTVAYGGIVFAPGSAGTMQEIFQEATQNHYLTFGFASPMVFLDSEFWTSSMPAYKMLKKLSDSGRYENLLLSLVDKPEEVVDVIEKFQNS